MKRTPRIAIMRLPAHPRFACQGAAGQAEYILPAEKLPSQQDRAPAQPAA
jgi:hypothetical protein